MNIFPYLVEVMTPPPQLQSTTTAGANRGLGTSLEAVPGIVPRTMDIQTVVNELIAYAIILAGFLAIVYLLWGGIQYIISGGKDDKVKAATGTIRNAIIGLIVTILSVSIINFISRLFKLDLANYVSFEHILNIINNLLSFRFS
jgi:uncharacterized membrane protein